MTQSRAVQVFVKAVRLPALLSAALRWFDVRRRVPGTTLRYRVRYADTLVLARGLFAGGEYGALAPDAKQIRRFIDLGCNVGLFPLHLCQLRGDRDVAGVLVDGNPAMVEEARANAALNGLADVGVVHGLAGTGRGGETGEFWVTQNSMSSTAHPDLLGSRFGAKKVVVPVVDVLREWEARFGPDARVDLLKLDIEGCELDFLRANGPLLGRCDRVILEFHKPKVSLADVDTLLRPAGFRLAASTDDPAAPWGVGYFVRDPVSAVPPS